MISPKKQRDLPAQGATPQKPATGQESGFCPCCGDAMGEQVACIHFYANGKVKSYIKPNTESEG